MSNKRTRDLKCPAGFTLIEVVVALVILTVALGALMQLFHTGMRTGGAAETRVLATLHAQSRMARIGVETPLQSGELRGEIDDRFRWSAIIVPYVDDQMATPDDDPRTTRSVPYKVTVAVHWGPETGDGTARSVRLTSIQLGSPEP